MGFPKGAIADSDNSNGNANHDQKEKGAHGSGDVKGSKGDDRGKGDDKRGDHGSGGSGGSGGVGGTVNMHGGNGLDVYNIGRFTAYLESLHSIPSSNDKSLCSAEMSLDGFEMKEKMIATDLAGIGWQHLTDGQKVWRLEHLVA